MKPINQYIDHTCLKPSATQADIQQLCNEAIEYQFYSVCIPPRFVQYASQYLKGKQMTVCTVVGFPLGYSTPLSKRTETQEAIENGATEIDMVIAIGALKEGLLDDVKQDIKTVLTVCKPKGVLLKAILETALLTEEEIKIACKICSDLHVDFVKTSTGFSTRGVSVQDIQIMRTNLPKTIQIKASGGIKTPKFALELINAGADRLGCSSSIQIINQ